MAHPNDDCRLCQSLRTEKPIFENALWHLRPIEEPSGVPGWLILVSQRHLPGPGAFDDAEAASFGPTIRHVARVLQASTGALRIYTAALGEAIPHFHFHFVPRYEASPKIGWGMFDLQRAVKAGEIAVDPAEVARALDRFRAALAADPIRS